VSAAHVQLGDLYVPRSMVDDLVARRVESERAETPITFHGPRVSLRGLGRQPSTQSLLEETRSWAAIAASRVASRVQSIEPLLFVRRRVAEGTQEEEQLDEHVAKEVLDRPNPIFSRRLLARLQAFHFLQCGEWYLQKLRDGIGVVRELWPLPPQNVEPISDPQRVIGGYKVTDGYGRQTMLPAEDVIRCWSPDPLTLFTAMGALGPQAVEWDTLRFLSDHLRAFFESDATPRVVLTADKDVTMPSPDDAQAKAFYAHWRNRFHKVRGDLRGLPVLLPSGVSPEVLDAHGGDAALVELDRQRSKQILSAYGVPESIAGLTEHVNRASAETNLYVFDQNTIAPLLDLFAEAYTEGLAREYDPQLFVRYEDFVAPDKTFDLLREQQDLVHKVRSVQQVLRDRGADPEDAPWGELPVGTLADEPYTGEEREDSPEDAADLAISGGVKVAPSASVRTPSYQRIEATSPDAAWARLLAAERQFVSRFERAMATVFDAQRKAALARLRAVTRARVSATDVFDPNAWGALFERVVQPIRRRAFASSGREALHAVGSDVGFTLKDHAAALLARQGAQLVSKVNAVTLARLREELSAGTLEGEGVDQLAKRISGVFQNRKRARTVARTELLKAHESGQLEGFRQGGVPGKQWNTSRDDAVRDSHEIDGQVQALEEDFELASGNRAAYPGDDSLPADEVVNCRCFVTPVLEED
jgi:phage portal protein BeeE